MFNDNWQSRQGPLHVGPFSLSHLTSRGYIYPANILYFTASVWSECLWRKIPRQCQLWTRRQNKNKPTSPPNAVSTQLCMTEYRASDYGLLALIQPPSPISTVQLHPFFSTILLLIYLLEITIPCNIFLHLSIQDLHQDRGTIGKHKISY